MGLRVDRAAVDPFLRGLAPGPRKAVRRAMTMLAEDPRHPRLNIKLLQRDATDHWYRVRVGEYRIVYAIAGEDAYVHRVFHRRDGYGWLERA